MVTFSMRLSENWTPAFVKKINWIIKLKILILTKSPPKIEDVSSVLWKNRGRIVRRQGEALSWERFVWGRIAGHTSFGDASSGTLFLKGIGGGPIKTAGYRLNAENHCQPVVSFGGDGAVILSVTLASTMYFKYVLKQLLRFPVNIETQLWDYHFKRKFSPKLRSANTFKFFEIAPWKVLVTILKFEVYYSILYSIKQYVGGF
jgi:hypothetical protein